MKKKKLEKNQNKKNTKFYKIVSVTFLILSCIFTLLLLNLKVLPNKYLIPIIGVLVVLNLVVYLSLRFSKNKVVKIFSILGCIGLFYGVYSLANTSDILASMNINYKINNYVVLVKKDSSYENIKDLDSKKIGYLSDDSSALEKIKINYESKEYNDVDSIVDGLFDEKVDGIILEQSYYDMLTEEGSPIDGFKDKVRIIYTFKVTTKVKDISKDVDTTKESFCIYISGVDTYGSIASSSRTDANMLVVVNPKTHQILLVSIPRDYYVQLAGKSGKDKLTHSGIYGIDTTVKTVENLLDIDINYYYKINFTSLINIVDALNGVDVYSQYTFTSKDGYNYTKGYNHVDGKEALSFVRERKAFSAGDRVRNINQQAMVEALFRKVTNPSILVKYNSLLSSLKNSFITNMPQKSLTALINNQLDSNAKWNISSYNLDGSNSREYTYSYQSNTLYVMIPNQDTINESKQLINKVYDGNILESSYDGNATNVNTVTKTTKKNTTTNSNKTVTSNSNTTSNTITTKEYSVTYIIDDNKNTVTVKEGSVTTEPQIPEKEGYEVLGWYLNGTLYNFSNPVNSDLVLEAKYKEIEIDIPEEDIDTEETKEEDINQE